MSELAAQLSNVSHSYGSSKVLRNVTFDVENQSFFGLLGPNGSGKTTLFRILSTLIAPTEGQCRVMGFDTVTEASDVRVNLGVIFQQPSLDEELTVNQNLTFHGTLYGLRGARLKERIHYLAERIGIQDRLDSRVSQLSGGLKRRADLVRGLLHRPRLLLLDEPTTGLDPAARHAFWQLLSTIRRDEQLTLVLTTHLLEEASSCDRVVILDAGRTVVVGNPDDLCSSLGDEMLWLTSHSLTSLAQKLFTEFGLHAEIINSALCISDSRAIASLPELYDSLGSLIDSATIRKPTLEDVFLTATGKQITPQDPSLPTLSSITR